LISFTSFSAICCASFSDDAFVLMNPLSVLCKSTWPHASANRCVPSTLRSYTYPSYCSSITRVERRVLFRSAVVIVYARFDGRYWMLIMNPSWERRKESPDTSNRDLVVYRKCRDLYSSLYAAANALLPSPLTA